MRVERVRYFLAAIETGSLRSAADRCGISQPALGQQLSLLEEELDIALLIRSRIGVRPTPAGQALIGQMTQLVAAEDAILGAAAAAGGAYRGRVAIGANPVIAETIVAPAVGRLRGQHPDLRFTVVESGSSEIESAVVSGELDFGVAMMPTGPPSASIERSVLLQVPIGVVVRRDHLLADRDRVQWEDLKTWPIVTTRDGTAMAERLRAGIAHPDVVVEVMSAHTVKAMVAHGAGIGVLAQFDTPADLPGLQWIPVWSTPPIQVELVLRRDSRPSSPALVVRRLITDRAAELLAAAATAQR